MSTNPTRPVCSVPGCGRPAEARFGKYVRRGRKLHYQQDGIPRYRLRCYFHSRKKQTPEQRAYYSMLGRCYNPEHPAYHNYGGRGIKVCSSWRYSYQIFLADMGRRPSADLSLERVDNDGYYEPSNCTWATRVEQGHNRRTNRWLTIRGETLVFMDWVRRAGVNAKTISQRAVKKGLTIEQAIEYYL